MVENVQIWALMTLIASPLGFDRQEISNGSGSAPNGPQAITWPSDDEALLLYHVYVQLLGCNELIWIQVLIQSMITQLSEYALLKSYY